MSARGYHRPPQEGRSLPPQQRHATPLPALPSLFGAPRRALGRPRLPAAGPRSSRRRPLFPLPPPSPSRPKQRRERRTQPTLTKIKSKRPKTGGAKKQQGQSPIGSKFILYQWHVSPASFSSYEYSPNRNTALLPSLFPPFSPYLHFQIYPLTPTLT